MVEKYREKGKEIKHIGKNYYLHSYKTIYDKEKKDPKKVSTGYRGKITPEGLIPPTIKEKRIVISYPLEFGASNLQNDISYTGWLFVNHIALMLYYRILKRLEEKNQLSQHSVADIISRLKRVTKPKVNDKWIVEKGTKINF